MSFILWQGLHQDIKVGNIYVQPHFLKAKKLTQTQPKYWQEEHAYCQCTRYTTTRERQQIQWKHLMVEVHTMKKDPSLAGNNDDLLIAQI